jgi:hypothetical protein
MKTASRHPRQVRELLAAEMLKGGQVMVLITGEQALARLTRDCKFPDAKARRLLNIAWEFGQKAEPCPGGYVHIWYHGQDDTDKHIYSVVEHIGPVANSEGEAYTERSTVTRTTVTQRKERTMPPRKGRQAAPEPVVEETANGASKLDNVQKYLDRDNTPTLADYAEWFDTNVVDPSTVAADRLIGLAVTFYGEFQASDFNRDRKAERKAEREAAAPAEEPEPAKPAGRARGAGKPAAAKPAAAKPAARAGRGRAAKPATSGAAVY